MYKYFYQLGHCQDLSIAEFAALFSDTEYKIVGNWLFCNSLIDVNITGGLVFGGEVVASVDYPEDLLAATDVFLSDKKMREIGLFLQNVAKADLYPIVKKYVKRINVVGTMPNFGHWKSTNNWLVSFKSGDKIILGSLTSYADQGFWAQLDMKLPHSSIDRGIINLKLARSLLNLTATKNVWDPFAGQGRILLAGMDIKEFYVASDIDELAVEDLIKNDEWFRKEFVFKNRFNKQKLETLARLDIADTADVTSHNFDFIDHRKRFGIVTEGTLGKNFGPRFKTAEALAEAAKVNQIWKTFLGSLNTNFENIDEIVGCVPCYDSTPDFDYDFWKDTKFIPVMLLPQKQFVKYAREKTGVGHLVFKLIAKN